MCRKRKLAKYRRQKGKCLYCGKQTFMFKHKSRLQHPKYATLEHLRPYSRWSQDTEEVLPNIFLCCRKCNDRRGNGTLKRFLKGFHPILKKEIQHRIKRFANLSQKQYEELLKF